MATQKTAERVMGRVLVTGGSGFLGRNVIRDFVAKGVSVRAIGRSDAARATVASVGAEPVTGDLSDVAALRTAAAGCDTVIHCAASVAQWGDRAGSWRANVDGTNNVMEAARAAGVSRVVHIGTEAACVPQNGGPLRSVTEQVPLPDPPFPGDYSTTKNAAERAAVAQNRDGLEVVVVRPRFIWGRDDSVVLPAFADAAKKGVLKWFNGGEYLTSTCHVDNVIEGIELAATKGRPGEAYFLTDGEPVRFRDFISEMLRSIDVTPPTSKLPLGVVWAAAAGAEWFCGATKLGQPFVTRQALVLMGQEVTVSDAKARSELGYEARVSVADGLADLRRRHASKIAENSSVVAPKRSGISGSRDRVRRNVAQEVGKLG